MPTSVTSRTPGDPGPSGARRAARTRTAGLAAVAVVALTAATACGGSSSSSARRSHDAPAVAVTAAPVAIDHVAGPGTIKIGVLVSASSPEGQGVDDLGSAAGARVAAYRLGLGGTQVELVVQPDNGTTASASQAAATLVRDNVAGIVMASTGSHLDPAIRAISKAGVPVLLPYYRPAGRLPGGVWLTGPDQSEVAKGIGSALQIEQASKPLLVTADGVTAGGIHPVDHLSYKGNLPQRLVDRIRAGMSSGHVDSVVIAASAPTQAAVVGLLQGALPDLPLVLTPEAQSPAFAKSLAGSGVGTLTGDFLSVGPDAGDTTTLSSSASGQAAASYFAALRLAAADPQEKNLFDSGPFSQVAGTADIASHDAVVALADAASTAGSTDPVAVGKALAGLTLDAKDGLAGPALDFSQRGALPSDEIRVLKATTQDPGVRPGSGSRSLYWFAVPAGGS